MIEFSPDFLDALVAKARLSPRGRQHHNVHTSPDDPSQRFFNAIEEHSYIRPHRHLRDPRRELLLPVRGSFAALTFDDQGDICSAVRIVAGGCGSGLRAGAVGVEIEPGDWHTVIAMEPGSVLLEVKAGPYLPCAAKEFATWAPMEGGDGASAYLERLRCCLSEFMDVTPEGP